MERNVVNVTVELNFRRDLTEEERQKAVDGVCDLFDSFANEVEVIPDGLEDFTVERVEEGSQSSKFSVELEYSEPVSNYRGVQAKIGNAIADALAECADHEGIVPDTETAFTKGITVRYHPSGELCAYRKLGV